MNGGILDNLNGISDPHLKRFLEEETQKQKFQLLVLQLTDQCWDKCMVDKPSTRLDYKTQQCLANCVDRFLDTSNYIINRMEKFSGLEASPPVTPDLMH